MAVQYDPSIIQKHAQALYKRATGIIFVWGFLGFIAGVALANAMSAPRPMQLVGGLGMALLGFVFGRGQSFALQLQAQAALCQVAMEANTRKTAEAVAAAMSSVATGSVKRPG